MNTKEDVLQNCMVEGNIVKLPNVTLDRKLYQDVAKSLQLIGGNWKGGNVFGFVFPTDPTDLLSQIANGEKRNLKKEFQFYETPKTLANELAYIADIKDTDIVLEPSAGQGAIIRAINEYCNAVVPDCYELMDVNRMILNKSGLKFNLLGDDFFTHKDKMYTKIIANPPFTKNADIEHLQHMYKFLSENGKLVCITSESWEIGSQKKQIEFKEWLSSLDSEVINIDRGIFKESGTMVGGNVVVINK